MRAWRIGPFSNHKDERWCSCGRGQRGIMKEGPIWGLCPWSMAALVMIWPLDSRWACSNLCWWDGEICVSVWKWKECVCDHFFSVVKYEDFGWCSEIKSRVWSSYENGSQVLFWKHFDCSAKTNHLFTSQKCKKKEKDLSCRREKDLATQYNPGHQIHGYVCTCNVQT